MFGMGEKAVEYAKKACELSEWENPILDRYSGGGVAPRASDFDNAVNWENKYLESNLAKDDLGKARQRLSLYEQKKPYREDKP